MFLMHFRSVLIFVALCGIIMLSCNNNTSEHHGTETHKPISEQKLKDQFIKANQQVVQKENDEMDYYAKSHQMAFVKTASGIRYFVYKPSVKGDSIKDGMEITIDYKVSLLDGTECYSSKETGKKTFIVGQENIESGIHKGVQFLKKGDKALIMIPSHLAHGLLGDFKKIPPQMPIVYDVQIQ